MTRPARKQPTPQAISRMLARAGFTKAKIGVRGRSGYNVRNDWSSSGVLVNHWTLTGGNTRALERHWLQRYAKVIEHAGYRAEYDERKNLLLVTALEG